MEATDDLSAEVYVQQLVAEEEGRLSEDELLQLAEDNFLTWTYWVNDENTVAARRKGEWPYPGEGWHNVDKEGYDLVVESIQEIQRANVLAMEDAKKEEKIARLIMAGLSPEVAKILVES